MANNMFLLIGPLALALGAVLLVAAALHDVAARTIPNGVPLALCALGVLLRLLDSSLVPGLLLGLAVFAVAVFCWRRGWLGGGDVKLLAAAAMFVPPAHVGEMLIAVAFSGGAVGLIYLFARLLRSGRAPRAGVRPHGLLARIVRIERRRLSRGGPLPYAAAIAAGTIIIALTG